MAKHAANPCDLLDKADFDTLGLAGDFRVKPPGATDTLRACRIEGGSDGGMLDLTLRTDKLPLQEAYDDTSGKYEFIQLVDLRGFPVVVRGRSIQSPGTCEIAMATGKQQGITLFHPPSSTKGGVIGICGRLATVAEAVLRKLGA